ncbi:invasion associated locus B family protein [Roseibium aggregatum]|uniref:Invasion associated locus B family protein n=1 Tax=Roseibium aggregatum TaxID=187304 RepID=A0A939J3H1_9HYPH|nr:invasion associated locus B family protein [Roseibium aggregatum]MBN9670587.1 invasion associated locus B family protein [Roseibium aggregatum]
MKSVLKRGLLGCAFGAGVVLSSFAGAPAIAQEEKSPWEKFCNVHPNTKKEICATLIEVRTNTGQFLTSVVIQEIEGEARKKLIISVPTGVLLQPGLSVRIDDNKPLQPKYSICAPNACIAELAIDDTFINAMKQGGEMRIVVFNQYGKENLFKATLIGFTKVYDGAPMTLQERQERQQQLQSELQKKADEARQKLIDAQKQGQ